MSVYSIARIPILISGTGSLHKLPRQLTAWAVDDVLLVTDEGVAATGIITRVRELLAGHVTELFVAPAGEPHITTVDAAIAAACKLRNPAVIGIGGGTALDIAKLAAGAAVGTRPMDDYMLCAHPFAGHLPSVMIPTTSGTGAEVTRTCVLTDRHGHKSWAWDDELCPDVAILDPELTVTLPPGLTTTTGLDAFVHAIEAASGQRTNNITNAFALQAIRLVCRWLPLAVAEPANLVARQQMQEGACLAGIAINQGGTGLAHAIGHALGTLYHMPHGLAVSAALDAILAWNVEQAPDHFHSVAEAMHSGATPDQVPALFAELLAGADLGAAAHRFAAIEIDAEDLTRLIFSAENLPMVKNNAKAPSEAEGAQLAHLTARRWRRLVRPTAGAPVQ